MFHDDCIFCKIVQGHVPCARVLEDETFLAFLDIAPVHPGHALVIPKAHHATLFDLPPDVAGGYMAVARRVGEAVLAATGAAGLNLMMNNHRAAGQLVDHAHVHLVPRFEDDGLRLWPQGRYPDNAAMAAMAEKIRAVLG